MMATITEMRPIQNGDDLDRTHAAIGTLLGRPFDDNEQAELEVVASQS